jgi:hypothetical protein
MVSFARTLQKHITKTGAHYVISIPREIAQDLQLEAAGYAVLKSGQGRKANLKLL